METAFEAIAREIKSDKTFVPGMCTTEGSDETIDKMTFVRRKERAEHGEEEGPC